MTSVSDNLQQVLATIPSGVTMVAVSKFHPIEALLEAYGAGQRIFGESRQQELLKKAAMMPDDVRWHFIGHLQTNKVRSIIGKVAMIESVDSERLLDLIDRESAAAGVVTEVLLQVHVAAEDTKFGFTPDELAAFMSTDPHSRLKATRLRGVMGMATNTDDKARICADFEAIADSYRRAAASAPPHFDVISMGMTHDYQLAIACGANMVRIGTAIFGEREY